MSKNIILLRHHRRAVK